LNESIIDESNFSSKGIFNFRMERYNDKKYVPLTLEEFIDKVRKEKDIQIGYQVSDKNKYVVLRETGSGSEVNSNWKVTTLDDFVSSDIAKKCSSYKMYSYTGGYALGIVFDASVNHGKGFIEYSPSDVRVKEVEDLKL